MMEKEQFNQEYNKSGVKPKEVMPLDNSPIGNAGLLPNRANLPASPSNFLSGQTVSSLIFQSGYSQRRIRITMDPADNPEQGSGSIAIINEAGQIIAGIGSNPSGTESGTIGGIQYIDDIFLNISSDSTNSSLSHNLVVFQVLSTSATGRVVFVDQLGTGESVRIQKTNATGNNVVIISGADTTGIGLVTQAQGSGAALSVSTSSAGTGIPCQIDQTNSSNANFPLVITNSASDTTNFKKIADFPNANVYTSNGTTPNGVLSAQKGSICLGSSATGQIAYNTDGSTAWTLI